MKPAFIPAYSTSSWKSYLYPEIKDDSYTDLRKLDDLERSLPALPSLSSKLQLRAKLLQEAQSIKREGYQFRILVYAWKRRASLKRLLDSLMSADYMGFTVHLDFHMDGGAHPAVVEFIAKFHWPYGKKRINRHGDRVGLERVDRYFISSLFTELVDNNVQLGS